MKRRLSHRFSNLGSMTQLWRCLLISVLLLGLVSTVSVHVTIASDGFTEDFSQDTGVWTEYDPDGKIELDFTSDHRLEFNNWIRYNPGYVSRPYSTQDFLLEFDIRITASGGNAKVIGPGFSDILNTIDQIPNGIHVVYYAGFPTVSPRLSINTRVDGTTEWGAGGNPPKPNRINIGKNVTYYVRLEKSGNTLTLSVFSDPARTTHIAGSPKTVTTSLSGTTFNYFYAVNGYTTSPVGNWEWTTGWIDNIVVSGQGGQPVEFPDPNLEQAIRDAIGKPTGDIYPSDLVGLTRLKAYNNGITDLTGLEYCTNLEELNLGKNHISDITPLFDLTNLVYLVLADNQISDITLLSRLHNLTELYLQGNQISDISPLSGLYSLTKLELSDNQISDISPLSGLTNLVFLWLGNNQISNISALSGLTNITNLNLAHNQISNISALSGLTNLEALVLGDNQISNISPLSGLTKLRMLWMWDNQISNIHPLSGLTNLEDLKLHNNQISGISPLSGLTNLDDLTLDYNNIRDIQPLVDNSNSSGLGSGDYVHIMWNFLDLTAGSEDMENIQALENNGVTVWYESQKPCSVLTVTKGGTGGGTVTSDPAGIDCGSDCTEGYGSGTVVTLTATPDANSTFASWSGHCSGTNTSTTITMDTDKTCTATFSEKELKVPYFSQGDTQWCLLNSVAMVMQYYGKPVHPWDLAEEFGQGHDSAFVGLLNWSDLKSYVESWNLDFRKEYFFTYSANFNDHIRIPLGSNQQPQIFSVGLPYNHAIVVVGYSIEEERKYIYIHDPRSPSPFNSLYPEGATGMFIKVQWQAFVDKISSSSPVYLISISGAPSSAHSVIWVQDDTIFHKINGEIESGTYSDKGLKYRTDWAYPVPGFDQSLFPDNSLRWLRGLPSDSGQLTISCNLSNPLREGITRTVSVRVRNLDTQTEKTFSSIKVIPGRFWGEFWCADIPLEDINVGTIKLWLSSEDDEIGPIELEVMTAISKGDVNGDGVVNVIDARICWQGGLGLISLTANQQKICDVDNDGDVDKDDSIKIAKYSIGIITSLAYVPTEVTVAGLLFPFVFLGIGLISGLVRGGSYWNEGSQCFQLLRRWRMPFNCRIVWIVLMLILVAFTLSSCISFTAPTALIIKDVEITDRLGAKAKIYILVTKMPGGGIASIQASVGSFSWDPKMFKVLDVKGLGGFTVLAQSFDNAKGTGGFAAVNPSAGVVNGNILEIIVKWVVPSDVTSSGLEMLKSQLTLGDAANNAITNYTLVNGEARLGD